MVMANYQKVAMSRERAASISSKKEAGSALTDLLAAAPLPLDTPWALQIQPAAHNNHRGWCK